jgi:hypothetical protein
MVTEVRQGWYSKNIDESFWKQPEVHVSKYDQTSASSYSLMTMQDGYVNVSLRQVPEPSEESGLVELCVSDTGKVGSSAQPLVQR